MLVAVLGLSARANVADGLIDALSAVDAETRQRVLSALDLLAELSPALRAHVAALAVELPVDEEQAHARLALLFGQSSR